MGLFDFLAEKGAQVFGMKTEGEQNAEKSTKIETYVSEMGLKIQNLKVSVEDETATVRGIAKSEADREKLVLAVGNIEGIAKVDDQLDVVPMNTEGQTPQAQSRFHDVKSGDTLSKIADQYYGDPMTYKTIFEANQPMLQSPDKIYPGQKLRIPEARVQA